MPTLPALRIAAMLFFCGLSFQDCAAAIDPTDISLGLATLSMVQGNYAKATAAMEKLLSDADAKAASDPGQSRLMRMRALAMLSRIAYRKDEIDKAYAYAQNAYAVYADDTGPKANALKIEPLDLLAEEYQVQKDTDHAIAAARQALDVLGPKPEPEWKRIVPLTRLGSVYLDQGKLDDAKAALEEAQELAYRSVDVGKKESTELYRLSMQLYRSTGDDARFKEMAWRSEAEVPQGLAMNDPKAQCQPHYPRKARREELQGTVKVEVTVDENGKFVKADVVESSGSAILDDATLDAFKRCTFRPASKDGKPVASKFQASYQWRLD